MQSLMPPPGRRHSPALERARPGDSDTDPPDWREDGRLHEMLFGDGSWYPVTVLARWTDRHGREVVQVSWSAGGESRYGEMFIADAAKIREA